MKNTWLVKRITDHEQRINASYLATYECYQQDRLRFRIHYHAKYNFAEQCTIQDIDTGAVIRLSPVKSPGSYCVKFLRDGKLLANRKGKKLLDAHNNVFAVIVAPGSVKLAIVRAMLNGEPDTYHLLSADKKSHYASIEYTKVKNRLFWPLSIIENISRMLISGSQSGFRYSLTLLDEKIEAAVVFGISVLLDGERGQPAI